MADNTERTVIGIAKFVAYVIGWLVVAVIIFRFAVPALWGSRSDLGLIAAPLAGAAGVALLAWLGLIFYRDLRKTFQ
ncbi:hypothetical protein QO010_000336 [Caulobacter ginsengisoli]|uniref:DUF4212 domain-containing protein n=1 Tax=Caulobacter ginsengisoli TaxID=400775 RepID=A0ABU0IKQ1_9CAUL|nr:hypothetical protein [Caulobacter ginsengisoli]MDQ0462588.1 hypothetical protein [Caulobacter ginsengisoli]